MSVISTFDLQSTYNTSCHELIGQRVFHTFPDYGPGSISDAYIFWNSGNYEIYITISFDNCRVANPFSLIKCIEKGLIIIENSKFSIDYLKIIVEESVRDIQSAVLIEKKRRFEAQQRIDAERRRLEEERLEAFFREQETQRLKAERLYAERLAAERMERETAAQEKNRIFNYLTETREVKLLAHFTPETNLMSIIKYGIMTRSALAKKGIVADTPDEQRFDNQMDYTSFSISFPNYRVFYNKRMNTPYRYVVLIIDPQIILDLPLSAIAYLPDNAASSLIQNVEGYTGFKAVQALFAEKTIVGQTMVSRGQLGIPDWFPTNPQAEVFVRSSVDTKYIRSIITESSEQAKQVKAMLQNSLDPVPKVIYNKTFFRPRDDWAFWKTQSNA